MTDMCLEDEFSPRSDAKQVNSVLDLEYGSLV